MKNRRKEIQEDARYARKGRRHVKTIVQLERVSVGKIKLYRSRVAKKESVIMSENIWGKLHGKKNAHTGDSPMNQGGETLWAAAEQQRDSHENERRRPTAGRYRRSKHSLAHS